MRCSRLVLIFARLPREERRAKPLLPAAAPRAIEALHRHLLRRTLAAARAVGVATRLVTTSDAPPPLGFAGLEVVRQIAGTFAERLERAVADAFADGWRQVVVVGGDTPDLDAAHLRQAFASISGGGGRRAALGPSHDGGYYLLALNAFAAAPFRVPLCTADTAHATVDALAGAGFDVTTLERLGDVDDEADVRALLGGPLRRVALLVLATRAAGARRCQRPAANGAPATIHARGPPVLVSIIS